MKTEPEELDEDIELPLEANFVEQAEYIGEDAFLALNADHPDEVSILRRLSVGGAKLLIGPRGCGKTTLMLKAYYGLLRDLEATTLPIYVNFKLSLKLEPLYASTPNATFWFRAWLNLKIYEGLYKALEESQRYHCPQDVPDLSEISSQLMAIEAGKIEIAPSSDMYTTEGLSSNICRVLSANHLVRCVLLLDDAAHAFSPRQQEDFFEFFRQVKSREISPKAAVYPGITTLSPTFHVGHDAEPIDVWVRPDRREYIDFMYTVAAKRFNGVIPEAFTNTPGALEFLAYASFGIPRSFQNMLRTIYHEEQNLSTQGSAIDRRKLLDVAKQSRESAHNVYDSLSYKLPPYKKFVDSGREIYQNLLSRLKEFNRDRPEDLQAYEVGIKRPVSHEINKVLGFLQYAGILMPVGENSRGIKGVFELYMIHFGDLITENAILGRRTKSVQSFVTAFSSQTHQAWPRISPETLAKLSDYPSLFALALPHCQQCGVERVSEHAKFCQNCGAQLKVASLYNELAKQDISVLPLSKKMVSRIKQHSTIRTIKDILLDIDRVNLRSIGYIGPIRAARISNYAEEYLS